MGTQHLQGSPWERRADLVGHGLSKPAAVPCKRILHGPLAQLKILQEVITLCVFVPFAVLYMGQPVKLDFLWAGLCLLGAVYFIFRG